VHGEAKNTIVPFNVSRSEDAQQRIREAVKLLDAQGNLPATATARANAIVEQGISLKTLYRHRELWHPIYDQGTSSDQSKIAQPEPVTAICEGDRVNTSESPESSDSGKFYTSEKDMKGRGFGSGLSQISTFDRSPTSRREPSTESVTVNSALSPLQLFC
jgi:hypothetical protein